MIAPNNYNFYKMDEWLVYSSTNMVNWKAYPVPLTEALWIHKNGDWYYLSYAYQFSEKTAYAMSCSITGPWVSKGILNELSGNCNTSHQSIIEYKNNWYFIYPDGGIQPNGCSFRRSVCIDRLYL